MSRSAIPRDVREFLDDYPNNEDDETQSTNLEFYSNQRRCRPDHMLIDDIHESWKGDWAKLEYKHGFIQWLYGTRFPIREHGMNFASQPLQIHEITAMKKDPEVMGRVLQSYCMMLEFYGMKLDSPETGLLSRVMPESRYADRYRNLVRSSHNYLRISRILKCLSELGLEHLNAGFLLHVLNEQSEHGELNTSGLKSSMDRWWAHCIRNEEEREWLGGTIKKVRADTNFIFSRRCMREP
ncbi:hypothetical protein NLI96_g5092 [Meripilus lineatus]|uniref:Opioid growth factor receptor (OGFr) conserved domain-containing protein n=1 Tax=Meripilus lineatus TaxID=2056292 RepID=A0AAD5V409_9APHY|nr:hypothetical protein NLI96_g5092 [Physisporinus lineatus]